MTTKILARRAIVLGLAAISFAGPAARAGNPGFDCKLAKTPVEHAICDDDGTNLRWLDRTMTDLFSSVRASDTPEMKGSLVEAQRLWLRERDACGATKATTDDCLSASYAKRLFAMTKPYDTGDLSGVYASRNGTMRIVAFPNGSLAYDIDSTRGPPSYNSCAFSATDAYADGKLSHRENLDPQTNDGAAVCTLNMTKTDRGFAVASNGCSYYCGYGTRFDGLFKK